MTIKGRCPTTPEGIRKSLKEANIDVFELIWDKLSYGVFDLSKSTIDTQFVRMRADSWGSEYNRKKFFYHIHQITHNATKGGLRICTDQEVFKLRRHYKNQPVGEKLIVASRLIDWSDDHCVLTISNTKESGKSLDARLCDRKIEPDIEIVFAKV